VGVLFFVYHAWWGGGGGGGEAEKKIENLKIRYSVLKPRFEYGAS